MSDINITLQDVLLQSKLNEIDRVTNVACKLANNVLVDISFLTKSDCENFILH